MSFARTLIALGLGFAAARGVDRIRKAGGMDAVKDGLRNAGAEGGVADQLAKQAEKLGLPVDSAQVRGMADSFGKSAAQATEATEAGLGSLIATATAAAQTGMSSMSDIFGRVAEAAGMGNVTEDNARLMIRAMIAAAKADGEISAEEREEIMSKLGDASEEEIAFVEETLAGDVDLADLAKEAGEGARAQVYTAALMVTKADSEGERAFLKNLASVLGLEDTQVAELHDEAGVKRA
ncbi:DUF533 domain-containing protein [Paracoccus sp. p4-l81]|uniref:DUF533 domain-containing protein n=1 Tax=unclassified Paracoccus (in: a-proteobacteria) TaxID=2688777 RepID=UPI0035BAC26B